MAPVGLDRCSHGEKDTRYECMCAARVFVSFDLDDSFLGVDGGIDAGYQGVVLPYLGIRVLLLRCIGRCIVWVPPLVPVWAYKSYATGLNLLVCMNKEESAWTLRYDDGGSSVFD